MVKFYLHALSFTKPRAEVEVKQYLMQHDIEHQMLRSTSSLYNFVFVKDKRYIPILIMKFSHIKFNHVSPQSAEGILSYYANRTLEYI